MRNAASIAGAATANHGGPTATALWRRFPLSATLERVRPTDVGSVADWDDHRRRKVVKMILCRESQPGGLSPCLGSGRGRRYARQRSSERAAPADVAETRCCAKRAALPPHRNRQVRVGGRIAGRWARPVWRSSACCTGEKRVGQGGALRVLAVVRSAPSGGSLRRDRGWRDQWSSPAEPPAVLAAGHRPGSPEIGNPSGGWVDRYVGASACSSMMRARTFLRLRWSRS